MIEISDVEAAARRLEDVAIRTPLIENATLNEQTGGRILLKPECLQRTGSFKIRGAYNLLSQLSPEQAQRGVVAWSSGNHAQGVACAAGLLGIHAAIVMPEDAPAPKLDNTRKLGGEVITYDRYTGDREQIAREIAAERGAELTGHREPRILNTLAFAYASADRMEEALEIAQKALELASADGENELAQHLREQIVRYERGEL